MQNGHTENYADAKDVGKLFQRRKRAISVIRRVALCVFCLASGFFTASLELPFGTFPLGAATIAASTDGIPFVLVGAATGAVFGTPSPIIYICTYGTLVLMRLFLSVMADAPDDKNQKRKPFHDKVSSRIFCVTLVSLVTGIYSLIAGGFRYYDLAGVFFGMAATIASTFLMSLVFDGEYRQRILSKQNKFSAALPVVVEICKLLFAYALIFSARKINVGVISLSAACAFFITLYLGKTSSRRSPIKSAVCGLVLGFAVGAGAAPLYMLSGAVCSMLYMISPLSAVISACLCGSVWGAYIGGTGMLLSLMPSMILSGGLLLLWDRIEKNLGFTGFGRGDGFVRDENAEDGFDDRAITAQRLVDRDEQLSALSEAFSSLSDVLYDLSDKMRRPGILDLARICDGAFDVFCPGCPEREICWGLEYSSTIDTLGKLSEYLHTHGRAEISCLPPYLAKRCPNAENVIAEINRSCARTTELLLKSEKTEVFALDYEGMARILCDTLTSDDSEYENNSDLAEKITDYLYKCGFGKTSVICFGGRRQQITVRGISPLCGTVRAEELRADMEKLSGYRLVGPMFEGGDGGMGAMTFTARPNLKAECVMRTLAADGTEIAAHDAKTETDEFKGENFGARFTDVKFDGEGASKVCGDTVNAFISRKDYLYALISDGMGTGADAAFTSELCSVFLEKMLYAGNSVDTSLRMLNGLIRSKSSISASTECSASVDLFELDLLTGKAEFIKSGAVQSFIFRDGTISRFSSSTVPIGIIRSLDSERRKVDTRPGDIVVMVSDGIMQDGDDCAWLCELLANLHPQNHTELEELAEKIILKARKVAKLRGYEKFDDASVICIRLSEYENREYAQSAAG